MHAFEVINDRRKQIGLPVSELARRTDLPYQALNNALNGERNLTADEMVKLCGELDLEIKDFCDEEKEVN